MIKFLDLQKINAVYAAELKNEAAKIIDSGWYLLGEKNAAFESTLAKNTKVKYAITVGNGLDALRLILKAHIVLGLLNEGDEVIVPANTYIATILSICDNRLKPVLVEPSLITYNIDISKIEPSITKKTRAIMVVHLYGQVCWSQELEEIAKSYNLLIFEDNAQAIGAEWNGKRTGALGRAAGFSFYPGKNLGALGDLGAVTTNDDQLAEVIRSLANYGSKEKYINEYQGVNSRMDEIQAAFLEIKIKYIESENNKRREIARFYIENIKNHQIILPIKTWSEIDEKSHVWHLFVVRLKNRDKLQKYLLENEIQTLIHYPIPPHKQKAFLSINDNSYPLTETIHREVLSLPISPVMEHDEVLKVVHTINKFK